MQARTNSLRLRLAAGAAVIAVGLFGVATADASQEVSR